MNEIFSKTWFKISLGVVLFVALTVLLNETPFLYKESDEVLQPAQSGFLENANPIMMTNGNSRGILFVHGFPSTPATWIRISGLASEEGYDVFAPLLPGFGTSPEDMLGTGFSQWYSYLSNYYEAQRSQYEEFYVVGVSMGGTLTLKLLEDYSGSDFAPTASVISSAPVFLNRIFRGVVQDWRIGILRYVSWFIDALPPSEPRPTDDGNDEWVGYEGNFPGELFSLKMGMRDVRKNLGKITVPLKLMHAEADRTVPFENRDFIAKRISSEMVQTVTLPNSVSTNTTSHIVFTYHSTRDIAYEEMMSFIRSFSN